MSQPVIVVHGLPGTCHIVKIQEFVKTRGVEARLVHLPAEFELDLLDALATVRGVPADFNPVESEYEGDDFFDEYVVDNLADMKHDEDIPEELEAARAAIFERHCHDFSRGDVVATVCFDNWNCAVRELFPNSTRRFVMEWTVDGLSLRESIRTTAPRLDRARPSA